MESYITSSTDASGTFDALLVVTKLHIPQLPVQHVERSTLVELLNQGVQRLLTVLSAPAGYGKTTLLAEWAARTTLPVVWLSLEATDNDLARFLSYLIAALSRLDARIGKAALTRSGGTYTTSMAQAHDLEPLLTSLVNDLASYLTSDTVLILDDYHLITSESIHWSLAFLLDHLPARLHIVLGTRADPPLPLARLRARSQLSELRTAELRFVSAEVHTFLHAMGLSLSDDACSLLEQRAEGWIAGVQLLALALRGRADPTSFLHAFPGTHRFLLDYVSEEILAQQSSRMQAFLLHTSILERLCGPLCEAVTGQSGGQKILEEMYRANFFVSTRDGVEEWYRYHPLFAEALRSHLHRREPKLVPELYRRASVWYEQQQLLVEACDYALLARDFSRAAVLMEPLARRLVGRGEFTLLRRWLDLLPQEELLTHPQLGMAYIWMFLFNRQPERGQWLIEHLQKQLQQHEQETGATLGAELHSEIALLQVMTQPHNDSTRAIELVNQTLQSLPEEYTHLRSLASLSLKIALGAAHLARGDLAAAEEALIKASLPGLEGEHHFLNLIAIHHLTELYTAQGQLHKMGRLYEQALRVLSLNVDPPSLHMVLIYASYAALLREWNRLDAAERAVQHALEIHKQAGLDEFFQASLFLKVNIELARGNTEKVLELLGHIEVLIVQGQIPAPEVADMEAIVARLHLTYGQLEKVLRWARESGLHADDPIQEPQEGERYFSYMTLARVLIAQGRIQPAGSSLSEVLTLLERMYNLAERIGFTGWRIEILALKALILQAQGETPQALAMLGQAVALAEPEGYVRLFADEGQPMAYLLARVSAYTSASPSYIQTLLAAITPEQAADVNHVHNNLAQRDVQQALIDPLSPREMEVLRLLSSGASNQQIANQLVITVNTAKRHVKHILAKLAATNRTQAVARARELHLL